MRSFVVSKHRLVAACALALACSLPALASAQAVLTIGDRVSGEITSRSRINYNDGSRSAIHTLALKKDDTVALKADGALCARLSVFEAGTVLADSSRHSEGCEEGGSQARVSFRAPANGTYEIAVSGVGSRAYGPYRLQAEKIETYRGGPLRGGSEISDLITAQGNKYTLEVAELGVYIIDMRSGEFDSFLALTGKDVELEDDDGGNRLDARLRALLEPGSYTLTARGLENATGVFTLSVDYQSLPEGTVLRNSGALEADGATITGALSGAAREYSLVLDQRRQVTLDLASDTFDTLLEVSGQTTRVRDDDSAGEANSRIVTVLDAGTYVVHAGSTGAGSGLYTLRATTAAPPSGNPATLAIGSNASATLLPAGKDRYIVNISRAGTYRFKAASSGLDTMLDLIGNGERLEDDDDSGGGTDAQIEAELSPGRYELIVHAWDAEGGRYQISASAVR